MKEPLPDVVVELKNFGCQRDKDTGKPGLRSDLIVADDFNSDIRPVAGFSDGTVDGVAHELTKGHRNVVPIQSTEIEDEPKVFGRRTA